MMQRRLKGLQLRIDLAGVSRLKEMTWGRLEPCSEWVSRSKRAMWVLPEDRRVWALRQGCTRSRKERAGVQVGARHFPKLLGHGEYSACANRFGHANRLMKMPRPYPQFRTLGY